MYALLLKKKEKKNDTIFCQYLHYQGMHIMPQEIKCHIGVHDTFKRIDTAKNPT